MTPSKRTESSVVSVGAPGFLAQYAKKQDDAMVREMQEERVVPRLKIVQAMSKDELKGEFGEGSVIVYPGGGMVAERDAPFDFVALFFFKEFTKQGDINDPQTPFIVERSFDKNGDLAARSRDANTRFEPYGNDFKYRYVEHFCFPGVIYGDHPLAGQAAVLSFEKGALFQGKNFCSSWALRKIDGEPAPIWSCVWTMTSTKKERNNRSWFGIDFKPAKSPYIEEAQAETFHQMHEEFSRLHRSQLVSVDRTDGDADEIVVDEETAAEL